MSPHSTDNLSVSQIFNDGLLLGNSVSLPDTGWSGRSQLICHRHFFVRSVEILDRAWCEELQRCGSLV